VTTSEQKQARIAIDEKLGGLRSALKLYSPALTAEQKSEVADSVRGLLHEIKLAKNPNVNLQLASTNKG
jgi:hypothetical protein